MYFLLLLLFYSLNVSAALIEFVSWKAGPIPPQYAESPFPVYSFNNNYMTYPSLPIDKWMREIVSGAGVEPDCNFLKNEMEQNFQRWTTSLQNESVSGSSSSSSSATANGNQEKYLGTGNQVKYNLQGERYDNGHVKDSRVELSSILEMPAKATALLRYYENNTDELKKEIRSTAFFISPHILLTAGHNVFEHPSEDDQFHAQKKWLHFAAIAAASRDISPFGIEDIDQMFTTKEYFEGTNTTSVDIGIIILKKSIGWFTGFLGVAAFSKPEFLLNREVYVGGYPGTLGPIGEEETVFPNNKGIYLKTYPYMGANGYINGIGNGMLRYDVGASIGQSGAPISVNYSGTLGKAYVALGVHSRSGEKDFNEGVMFSPELFHSIINCIKPFQLKGYKHPILTSADDWKGMLVPAMKLGGELTGKATPSARPHLERQLRSLQETLGVLDRHLPSIPASIPSNNENKGYQCQII